jgi:drug/metabolite transporter (DMT)-like permease
MSGKEWIRFWLLGLIWGTSFLWIKIAIGEISPLVLVAFRTLFGAVSLLVIFAVSGQPRFQWKDLRPWLGVFLVVALINIAIPFIVISWSEQYIPSGIASILNSSVPLFTMMIAPFVLHDDQWSLPKALGLVIGFVGIVIIFLPNLLQGLNQNLIGMGGMLLASLSYAVAGIYTRRHAQGLAPQLQAFLQLGLATLMVWSLTISVEHPIKFPQYGLTWVALLWLGILGSGVAYILYFSLLHSIGPTRATTVTYIPPLVGTILGMVFLGEQLTLEAILGGILVVSGIAVVNIKQLPKWGLKNKTASESCE